VKLEYAEPPSNVAFIFNTRRYTMARGSNQEESEDEEEEGEEEEEEENSDDEFGVDANGAPRPREFAVPDGFVTTAVCHPDTYLNKILLGSSDGRLVLLNISTGGLAA
jgi:hypothetical protein